MFLYEIIISIAIISMTLPSAVQLMISISKEISTTQSTLTQIRETSVIKQILWSQLKDTQSIGPITNTTLSTTNTAGESIEFGVSNQKIYIKKGSSKVSYTDKLLITQFKVTHPAPHLLIITLNNNPLTIHLPNES